MHAITLALRPRWGDGELAVDREHSTVTRGGCTRGAKGRTWTPSARRGRFARMPDQPLLMALAWLGSAFGLGVVASRFRQPPLIGYLAAGFILEAFGYRVIPSLRLLSDVGLLLLLFTIGLKLDVRSIVRPEVWAPTVVHMALVVGGLSMVLFGLARTGLPPFDALSFESLLVVAFALSFSSTVFAVKVLEARGDMAALYGQVAVGVLVVQDVVAVVFLAASTGKIPAPWAILVLGLPLLRPVFNDLLERCGHGELLVLAGVVFALGSAMLFEAVGLKDGLGAIAAGAVLGPLPSGRELAKSMIGLKDVLLVGFFLSVGLTGMPTLEAMLIAAAFLLFLPLKSALFFLLFTRFRLRARSSWLSALSLGNFSEFGLIVATLGVQKGWLDSSWLIGLAIALALSFAVAAPINARAATFYQLLHDRLLRFERPERLALEQPMDASDAEVLIFGMGRIGTGAYDHMRSVHGDAVIGFDVDEDTLALHREAGRRVQRASATDGDLWERLHIDPARVELVMLTMPSLEENIEAIEILRRAAFPGVVAATTLYPDNVARLEAAGADTAFHALREAGAGFAQHVTAVISGEVTYRRTVPPPAP